MRHPIKHRLAWSIAGILTTAALVAAASPGQTAFEHRRDVMKQLGANFYLGVGRVVKGRAAYGPDTVTAAEALVDLTAALDTLFPPGSDVPDSKMKRQLLADPAKSAALAAAVRADATALLPVVRGGDKAAIAASYKSLSDSCEACHSQFRQEE
ncbi:MAG: cytochrome c prime [Rhodospirillales bacterium]|nr:cytochrome c prime [Rhodospirillales bacterium]